MVEAKKEFKDLCSWWMHTLQCETIDDPFPTTHPVRLAQPRQLFSTKAPDLDNQVNPFEVPSSDLISHFIHYSHHRRPHLTSCSMVVKQQKLKVSSSSLTHSFTHHHTVPHHTTLHLDISTSLHSINLGMISSIEATRSEETASSAQSHSVAE